MPWKRYGQLLQASFTAPRLFWAALWDKWYLTMGRILRMASTSCAYLVSLNICLSYDTYYLLSFRKEWESHEEFKSFLSSHDFETFIGQVGPLLTEPAIPQLFKTDLTVRHVPALPVTEIIRLRADPHYPRDSAWKLLIASIETHSGHAHPSVCGHSVNVEEELWLGIVAWDSLAVWTNQPLDSPFSLMLIRTVPRFHLQLTSSSSFNKSFGSRWETRYCDHRDGIIYLAASVRMQNVTR